MTAALTQAVGRRNQALREALGEIPAASAGNVAAIEIAAPADDLRDADARLVRESLAAGVLPAELGPLFVTVVADLTYEVDWKDHFRFWPILGDHLQSAELDLKVVRGRRRVAEAFEAFSQEFGGVRPTGAFAAQFPLMSRPLVHAVLPQCAQRHVARLLERATARGVIPTDIDRPWPVDDIVEVGDSLGLPLFVRGLMANRAVLERSGRVLLGAAPGIGAPPWVRRVARNVERDAITRDLVAEARSGIRRRSSSRRSRKEIVPSVDLVLDIGADASLWLRLGALSDAAAATPEMIPLARQGAEVWARTSEQTLKLGPLFNALASPLLGAVIWKAEPLTVSLEARPYESGQDAPETIQELLWRGRREFRTPVVLRCEAESRYAEPLGELTPGDRIALIVRAADVLSRDLELRGFARVAIQGAPAVVALVGVASNADAALLARANATIEERKPAFQPALVPPIRRENGRLVYPVDREIWLRLTGVGTTPGLRAELALGSSATAIDVGLEEGGEALVRVPADAVPPGVAAEVRAYGSGRGKLAAVTLWTEESDREGASSPRWRVALQPTGASVEHLSANQCWLEVDALPGVDLEVELQVAGATACEVITRDNRKPFETARTLRNLLRRLTGAQAQGFREAMLRVRSSDEPDMLVEIARLGPTEDPLRFVVDVGGVRIDTSDDEAEVWRLDFESDGQKRVAVGLGEPFPPGVYVATSGAAYAALCVAAQRRHLPSLPQVKSAPRGLEPALGLLSTLRAIEVAPLWPPVARVNALFLRRAAARSVERCLVGSLCGERWLRVEEELGDVAVEPKELAKALAPLLWLDQAWLAERLDESRESEDPFDLLTTFLKRAGMIREAPRARHLLLAFYQRGRVSPRGDEDAIRWAWADVQRARIVRAAFLAAPEALEEFIREGSVGDDAA